LSSRRTRSLTSERGTSVTETILLTWLLLVFIAAALQIFIMNESLYRSLTATHAQMFTDGFKHNHWEYDAGTWDNDCTGDITSWNTYNTDEHAKEIWRYQDFPEIRVPVLGMFRAWANNAGFKGSGSNERIDIQSNVRGLEPDKGCGLSPCKKIKMAAGPAGPVDEGGPFWSRPVYFPGIFRLYCKAGKSAIDSVSDAIDELKSF
jgi:hypothetical protein